MSFGEAYLKTIAQIGNFTKQITGMSIIDAYFGPEKLTPERVKTHPTPDHLATSLDRLTDEAKQIGDKLRRTAIISDLKSLKAVVKWLSTQNIPYISLVEEIFGITPKKFTEKQICKAQEKLEDASKNLPGKDLSEKILKWREANKITGQKLKKAIHTEIVKRTKQIERLFEKRVFTYLPIEIENNGVIYETETGVPWGAYNYYKGNYTSINTFNIDRSFNKYALVFAISHEYEHHVSNLFTEKHYRENKTLDLTAVLLHTKRSIISEGTANCAKDFLGIRLGGKREKLLEALGELGNMISLNTAYMLNVENADEETAAQYLASENYIPLQEARKNVRFATPMTPNGKPNFFKPYIYTYYYGRKEYVLPTYQKAKEKDKLEQFFQILYLNPYSRTTATWKNAFSKI
jgi:hypothetical protein